MMRLWTHVHNACPPNDPIDAMQVWMTILAAFIRGEIHHAIIGLEHTTLPQSPPVILTCPQDAVSAVLKQRTGTPLAPCGIKLNTHDGSILLSIVQHDDGHTFSVLCDGIQWSHPLTGHGLMKLNALFTSKNASVS